MPTPHPDAVFALSRAVEDLIEAIRVHNKILQDHMNRLAALEEKNV